MLPLITLSHAISRTIRATSSKATISLHSMPSPMVSQDQTAYGMMIEDAFPTDSYNAPNFWVDVVFSDDAP